jgi:hypothetical protein
MNEPLLAPTFLFHFSVPCQHRKRLWGKKGVQLDPKHRIPSFGELEEKPLFADFRAAWSENGLAFNVRVRGKKQAPWCRLTRLEDSDRLEVWVDTRDTHNIHRAGRFCHRFAFLPFGLGQRADQPIARMLDIHRARENPKPIAPESLAVRSEKRPDGYLLEAYIPAEALTGFDTEEHARLGFSYAIVDRELGWQTFSVGPEFPIMEDPSLWGTLELVR